jgi:hypothetical protein
MGRRNGRFLERGAAEFDSEERSGGGRGPPAVEEAPSLPELDPPPSKDRLLRDRRFATESAANMVVPMLTVSEMRIVVAPRKQHVVGEAC